MSNAHIYIYAFWISIASTIAIWSAHRYLKRKLGERHDEGYMYMAGAFACWAFMAGVEWAEEMGKISNDYKETWRIIFSALNNAFLVLSLSFIDHGWKTLSRFIQKYGLLRIAAFIGITTLLIGKLEPVPEPSAKELPHWFPRVDAFWSVIILVALSAGLAKTLEKRNMRVPAILSGVTGFIFLFIQLYVLIKEEHLKWDWFATSVVADVGEIARMLSRPMLLICVLLLALTWLGVGGKLTSESEMAQPENEKPEEPEKPTEQNYYQKEKAEIEGISEEDGTVTDLVSQNVHPTVQSSREDLLKEWLLNEDDVKMLVGIAIDKERNQLAEEVFGKSERSLVDNRLKEIAGVFARKSGKVVSTKQAAMFAVKNGIISLDEINF